MAGYASAAPEPECGDQIRHRHDRTKCQRIRDAVEARDEQLPLHGSVGRCTGQLRATGLSMLLPQRPEPRDAVLMPDRPFPAVEALIRRVQRIAASRPDPMHILAQTISMTGEIGADPYAVLGVLVEGAVLTIVQHIPAEQQTETAATLIQLLEERLKAHGVPGGDR